MPLSPQINNGRVLLQNTTDELWYYLGVALNELAQPTLTPGTTSVDISSALAERAAPSFVLLADNGYYYKITLQTDGPVVTYNLELLSTPEPSQKLFLRESTTGTFYEVVAVENEEDSTVYLSVIPIGNDLATINSPWRQITPVTFQTKNTIYVPATPTPVQI